MSQPDDLPTVTHTAEMDLVGYKLTIHVLSNGERVYEDTPELRRLFTDLGLLPRSAEDAAREGGG